MLNKTWKRFLKRFFGYEYYRYIKGPSHLCVVERVTVGWFGKSYEAVCFTTEFLAKAKVERYNKLWGTNEQD